MKVVLFCGGQGMRMREFSETIPKPMVPIGTRPVLWHLMRYYAHFGHTEFIICLGYGAQRIKDFFLQYNECEMNDFIYSESGRKIELLGSDIEDWRITFVDTGLNSNVGERLRRVESYLGDDEVFLANYADGLSDLDLNSYITTFLSSGKIACLLTVPAPHTFHNIRIDGQGQVRSIEHINSTDIRVNAGFFVLNRRIFDYMRPDEELVEEPFERLIAEGQLMAVPYDGYWQPMDTFKDKMLLDEMAATRHPPWQVWNKPDLTLQAAR
jgi:glucose-1-phosphate cytidylyltransferase